MELDFAFSLSAVSASSLNFGEDCFMATQKIFRRYGVFCCSLFVCALGVALITNSHIGTSPITSVPYVVSFLCPLSLGTLTFLMNVVFLLLQMLLLRKEFTPHYLLQLPAVLVFGLYIDLCMKLTSSVITDNYTYQLLCCVVGSAVLGLGITVQILSNATVLPAEGLLVVIAYKSHKMFGRLKIIFDSSLVLLALAISLLGLYSVVGLREGTVISALLVGNFVRLFSRLTLGLNSYFSKDNCSS